MQRLLALLALAIGAIALPGGAVAQDYPTTTRTISTERWVEEWDEASQRWVRVDADPAQVLAAGHASSITSTHIVNGVIVSETQEMVQGHERFAAPAMPPSAAPAIAQYGPFRVTGPGRAAMVGLTDQSSPAWFAAMLRDFPEIEVLDMVEAPGTKHDIANLEVGRAIRAAGIRTHVPAGGSVRSGAVELFLAGTQRTMDEGAQFAVHSWLDMAGREPDDFPEDHPANRLYLDYYMEMGMSGERARDFYAMTNSVPHSSALWLGAQEMRGWVGEERAAPATRMMLAQAQEELPVMVSYDGPLVFAGLEPDYAIAHAPAITPSTAPRIAYDVPVANSVTRPDASLLDS